MIPILHVVASLRGGGGRHLHALAWGLKRQGVSAGLLAPDDDPAVGGLLREVGVIWRALPLNEKPTLRLLRSLRKAVQELQPRIVHVHGHRAGLLTRLAMLGWSDAWGERPKVVCTFHGYHPTHYRWPWNRVLGHAAERLFSTTTEAYIAVSQETAEDAAAGLGLSLERFDVIPNGILLRGSSGPVAAYTARESLAEAFGGYADSKRVFYVGTLARLHCQKGVDLLLEAWKRFQEKRQALQIDGVPVARLAIAGSGSEVELFREQIREWRLEESVRLIGEISDSMRLLAGLDLFVLPSRWEGLPLTVLEAWDRGVPVLATDVTGTRELIRHDVTGFLAQPEPEALAMGLAILFGDSVRRERFVTNGRARVQDYSAEKMAKETLGVYRRVARGTPALRL